MRLVILIVAIVMFLVGNFILNDFDGEESAVMGIVFIGFSLFLGMVFLMITPPV